MRWARSTGFVSVLLAFGCGPKPPAERPPVSVVVAEAPPSSEPDPPAPPVVANDEPLLGTWEGEGVQNDGQRWRMIVTLTGTTGLCGTVDYPSIPCAAEWHCTGRDGAGNLEAVERLTSGRDLCVDGGTMWMSVNPAGQLDWSWEGGGIKANALLDRAR